MKPKAVFRTPHPAHRVERQNAERQRCLLYIGTQRDAFNAVGQFAKFAGIARYAEARGWGVVTVPWNPELRREVPGIIRVERPVGDTGGNEPLLFSANGTQVYSDENPSAANKVPTVFKVDADNSPFVDGEHTIHIDFAAANKNNWVDWDMLKIEPLRPMSPFVMVVR